MIYSLHLFTVEQPDVRVFLLVFRDGGPWHDLARRSFPGYIATSVLRNACSSQWLVIHFWINEESHTKAQQLPAMAILEDMAQRLTRESCDLGVFAFPPRVEADESVFGAFHSMTTRLDG